MHSTGFRPVGLHKVTVCIRGASHDASLGSIRFRRPTFGRSVRPGSRRTLNGERAHHDALRAHHREAVPITPSGLSSRARGVLRQSVCLLAARRFRPFPWRDSPGDAFTAVQCRHLHQAVQTMRFMTGSHARPKVLTTRQSSARIFADGWMLPLRNERRKRPRCELSTSPGKCTTGKMSNASTMRRGRSGW